MALLQFLKLWALEDSLSFRAKRSLTQEIITNVWMRGDKKQIATQAASKKTHMYADICCAVHHNVAFGHKFWFTSVASLITCYVEIVSDTISVAHCGFFFLSFILSRLRIVERALDSG